MIQISSFVQSTDLHEVRELATAVRRMAIENLHIEDSDQIKFRRDDFQKMSEMGLSGAAISDQFGGSSLSPLEIAALIFEIARVQSGPAIYLSVHQMVSRLLETWSENLYLNEQLKKLACGESLAAFCLTEASAGSDAMALKTQAERTPNGYRINGEKIYITSGGIADCYLVFARTSADPKLGISAFLIEAKNGGISFGKHERKMGCEGAPICSVHFDNCEVSESARVGAEGSGYKVALSGLNGGRINIAAAACGIAANALELAVSHAKERRQFGQAIADFQGIQFLLAEMATKLRAAILLTRDAARELAEDPRERVGASMAKFFATDAAMSITTDAVQIFGGAGYLKDYTVERLMRDAKMLQIVEGTNQIQRNLIARSLFAE